VASDTCSNPPKTGTTRFDGSDADQSVGGPTSMCVFRSTAPALIRTALPAMIALCGPVPAGSPVVLVEEAP